MAHLSLALQPIWEPKQEATRAGAVSIRLRDTSLPKESLAWVYARRSQETVEMSSRNSSILQSAGGAYA